MFEQQLSLDEKTLLISFVVDIKPLSNQTSHYFISDADMDRLCDLNSSSETTNKPAQENGLDFYTDT